MFDMGAQMYDLAKASQQLDKHTTSAKQLFVVLIVVLAALRAADFAWTLFAPKNSLGGSKVHGNSDFSAHPESVSLANIKLFDEGAVNRPADVKPKESTGNLKKTRLNLALSATMAHQDSDKSGAIVVIGNKQKIVWVGDKLPMAGNVVLKEVESDRVTLSNNGALESLLLDKKKDRSFVEKTGASAQANARVEFLKSWQKDVSIVPVMKGASVSGVRLAANSVKTRRFFSKVGLLSNDQIVAINGTKVSTNTNLRELTRLLATNNVVSLNVERNGSLQVVEISPTVLDELD